MSVTARTDTLREKLKKLVDEWRMFDTGPLHVCNKCGYCGETSEHDGCGYLAALAPSLLDQLAAILAEPCSCDDPYCGQHGRPPDISASAPGEKWSGHISGPREPAKPEEPKPLPLGHPYSAIVGDDGRACSAIVTVEVRHAGASLGHGVTVCGQPREAHEPKP